jgi:clan AA aspartic protease (TIGR02281 family)
MGGETATRGRLLPYRRQALLPLQIPALLLAFSVQADRVRLTNGEVLDGLVITQTSQRVVLDVGTGQIQLRRSQVAAIERTDAQQVSGDWQARYFLHPRFVPATCTNLADQLRRLQDQRRTALAASADIVRIRAQAEPVREALATDRDDLLARQARLAAVDTNAVIASRPAWEAYAQEVAGVNAQQARLNQRIEQQRADLQRVGQAQAIEAEYLRALDAADRAMRALPTTPEAAVTNFVAQATALLAEYRRGVVQTTLATTWENGHALVDVRVNGQARGRFLLDTGASTVVLAESMARRAGAQPDTNRTVRMQLADGRVVTGWPVILDMVEVGEASGRRIDAVVLPSAPAPDLEGLLGMSFLREFTVRVDAASGRVELLRLGPTTP